MGEKKKISILMTKSHKRKSVGIAGKYGVRYGKKIRDQIKFIEQRQHTKDKCILCSKEGCVKRIAVGIWFCKSCRKIQAGGAYVLKTESAKKAESTIRSINEHIEF